MDTQAIKQLVYKIRQVKLQNFKIIEYQSFWGQGDNQGWQKNLQKRVSTGNTCNGDGDEDELRG